MSGSRAEINPQPACEALTRGPYHSSVIVIFR